MTGIDIAASREEVEALIGKIGEMYREITQLGLEYGARTADLKLDYEAKVAALKDAIEQAEQKVRGWCEVNRERITNGRKSCSFPTGKVQWRAGRQYVHYDYPKERVIETLKRLGLSQFVRMTEDVNEQALLADPTTAATVPGIRIDRRPETFSIDPVESSVIS
jgi:phage host-nuclease inhibitor protein Gam